MILLRFILAPDFWLLNFLETSCGDHEDINLISTCYHNSES